MRTTSLIATLLLLAACGGSGASEPGGESSTGGDTAQYEGPVASTNVEAGGELFDMLCSDCHGDDGDAPKLTEEAHSPARIRQQVREGSDHMRPFPQKRLSDTEMEDLLAFLDSIGAVQK